MKHELVNNQFPDYANCGSVHRLGRKRLMRQCIGFICCCNKWAEEGSHLLSRVKLFWNSLWAEIIRNMYSYDNKKGNDTGTIKKFDLEWENIHATVSRNCTFWWDIFAKILDALNSVLGLLRFIAFIFLVVNFPACFPLWYPLFCYFFYLSILFLISVFNSRNVDFSRPSSSSLDAALNDDHVLTQDDYIDALDATLDNHPHAAHLSCSRRSSATNATRRWENERGVHFGSETPVRRYV